MRRGQPHTRIGTALRQADLGSDALSRFSPYVGELETIACGEQNLTTAEWAQAFATSLNGEPNRILRECVGISDQREIGAFFTGCSLAGQVVSTLGIPKRSDELFFDPTCGTGDLLLAVAKKLPLGKTTEETLSHWGRWLGGSDLYEEFVRAAKARLVLLARKLTGYQNLAAPVELSEVFPLIRNADFFSDQTISSRADVLVMNPPFGQINAPTDCGWGKGRVNAAAVFLDTAIRSAKPDTRILAILPDVLRSGNRYIKWRIQLGELCRVNDITRCGVFDRWTDVHVFVLDLKVSDAAQSTSKAWQPDIRESRETVGDRFEVRVGPVIPHRHKNEGTEHRYIHARSVPAWGTKKRISERRRFEGTVFAPPFVVIRRTSRPGDKSRAVGTIILGKGKVAVENHLIVLLPNDGTQKSCEAVIARLQSKRTDNFLDRVIRCRHLTTSAVAAVPW